MKFDFPEGATPIDDCSGLIPKWVQTLSDLNRVEAENISHAQSVYFRLPIPDPSVWFHSTELKSIHRAMFSNVWEWAGKQRTSVTSIGIARGFIGFQMAELCREVASWSTSLPIELTFLERAARIHHRLVAIHPFENGNGRFSRLVSDRCLLAWHCPHPMWPEQLNRSGTPRKTYIEALKSADNNDYEPLVHFMESLGAKEPGLGELLQNRFYQPHVAGDRGVAMVRAFLRRGADPKGVSSKGQSALQLAEKQSLYEIAEMLAGAGAKR